MIDMLIGNNYETRMEYIQDILHIVCLVVRNFPNIQGQLIDC